MADNNNPITFNTTSVFVDEFKLLSLSGEAWGLEQGAEVNIIVTHLVTNEQVSLLATVDANGQFELLNANLSALVDGDLMIQAFATVQGVQVQSEPLAYEMNADISSLSLEWVFHANTGLVDIVGAAADVLVGTDVELLVTDSLGQTFTALAVVNADGSFGLSDLDLSFLAPGEVSIHAQAIDNNGGYLSQDINAVLKDTAGSVELSLSVVSGDVHGITISGSLTGLPEGTLVYLSILDDDGNQQNLSVAVQANGNFSLSNIDTSVFTSQHLMISASAGEGNASGSASVDYQLPDSMAMLTLDNAVVGQDLLLDVLGMSDGFSEGTTVTISINDGKGHQMQVTTLVQDDGHFSLSGIAIPDMEEGMLHVTAMVYKNNKLIESQNAVDVELVRNHAPEGSDTVLLVTEDVAYSITAADLGFSDSDQHSLMGVKITRLPAKGTLTLGGVDVEMNQVISTADLDAGQLKFQGEQDGNGVNYASLEFSVQDSGATHNEDLSPNTLTFNVAAVNDAPILSKSIPAQLAVFGQAFEFKVPANTFLDVDSTLAYSATQADGSALPTWLSFDAASLTFKGTPTSSADLNVRVTASDGQYSVSDSFVLGVAPGVRSVALASAVGAQNRFLNAGDTLAAVVTFSESVNVTGNPQLALRIGVDVVMADLVSGSGTTQLSFSYKITSGQTDVNGISIDANALLLNAGSISDAAGYAASLVTAEVADRADFMVDTTAPAQGSMSLTDTGVSATDGFSQSGVVTVGVETGASWAYSTDNGANWTAGTDNSFTLAEGRYAAGAVKMRASDLAGNVQTGALIATNAVAISVDNVAPLLVASNPGDNGYLMNVAGNLTLTFNEGVSKGTGVVQIYTSAHVLVESFDVANSARITGWGGKTLSIDPTNSLDASTGYYVKVAPTAIKDLAGNGFAGISDATTLNFTTADETGSVVPATSTRASSSTTRLGQSLSSIGDFNGDGYDDLLIGDDAADSYYNKTNGGAAYVVYGNASGTVPNLNAGTIAASLGFRVVGGNCSQLGTSLSGAGDVNGDGYMDILLSTMPWYHYAVGGFAAYVLYGTSNSQAVFGSRFEMYSGYVPNNMGFKIYGPGAGNEFGIGGLFGENVSQLGDVNGDGLPDWAVTQHTPGGGQTAGTYVVYGRASGNYSLSTGVIAASDGFLVGNVGSDVSGAGDVNGDGLADMVVGTDMDTAFVVYGNSISNDVSLSSGTIANSQGFKIVGPTYSQIGLAVSSAGDVNGDGLADLVLGGNRSGTANTWGTHGAVYVVYGNSTGSTVDFKSGSLAASQGYKISSNIASNYLGYSVSSAGDMNGDGLTDLIVSAYGTNSVYVIYGNASGTNMSLGASIAPSEGFMVKGPVGTAVSSAGDINGDGLSDLLLGPAAGTIGYSVILGGTQWVTSAVNGIGTVEGTSDNEALIGSPGDDTLTGGGGVDRFYAGRGNDTMVLTAGDVANLANNTAGQIVKAGVNGGTGFDSIQLSEGVNLDLTTISNAGAMSAEELSRIDNIERFDLVTDPAANTLKLHTKDVNDIAGMNMFHTGTASADGKVWTNVTGAALSATTRMHQMLVDGGSNDTVSLNASHGTWRNVGTVNNGSSDYTVYENTNTLSQVLVKSGVAVQNVGAPLLISSNPTDSGYLMALGNNITLTFDQIIQPGNGTIQLWNGTTGAFVESFDVTSSTLVTGWSGTTLTINPTADLAPDTNYFLKIGDAAVQNAVGNTFSGVNLGTSMDFTTVNAVGSIVVRAPGSTSPKTLGSAVSGIGDVNGDGFDDMVIGAYAEVTPGSFTPEGAAYVVYGNASGTVPSLAAGSIASNLGFKLMGGYSSSLGVSVSGVGDVNGDGLADMLIGANTNGTTNTGYAAYVIYGRTTLGGTYLGLGIDASTGFKISGTSYLGQSVSGAGDVNGDGLADMLVTEYKPDGYGAFVGAAYVVYGNNTGAGYRLSAGTIAASQGFKITAGSVSSLGYAASSAGDFNGDGLADVIVSARTYGAQNQGAAYVVYGNSTGTGVSLDLTNGIAASQGFRISGQTGTNLGEAVSSAGDVNGDGLADVVVTSKVAGTGGSAYVLYGTSAATGLDIDLNASGGTIAASRGFRISDAQTGANLGGRVASAGDVNGDGLADLIVASPNGLNSNTYIVYGNANGTGVVIDSNGQIAASQGFRLVGAVGTGVAGAGDINGDGLADLVVGANPAANDYRYGVILGGTQWVSSAVDGIGTVDGTAASEALIGSAQADTLIGGGGVDRFFAGAGNDTVVLTASNVANLASNVVGGPKATVSGGNGFDTVRLSGGANLDLTAISNAGAMGLEENSRIESIERIDMATDTAANTLTLSAKDVQDMADFNAIHAGTASADGGTWTNVSGTALGATTKFHQLVIDGTAADSFVLAADKGVWTNVGTVSNGSINYTVYQNAGANTQVLVRSEVVVTNNDSVAPVVLDLNRDGELNYGHVVMDVNGDGQADNTAWAGPQDGVLVWDKQADGLVHDNSQYAFAQYATTTANTSSAGADAYKVPTDLSGLADAFDTNHDGVFNAQDAKFAEFKVWQDVNQNGVSDAGEVRSLADVGITTIHLTSDGVVRAPAVGVVEAGQTSAAMADGTSLLVADAAFAYSSQKLGLQDVLLSSSSDSLLFTGTAAGAVVANQAYTEVVCVASHGVAAQLLMDQQLASLS